MRILTQRMGPLATNCYLVIDEVTGEGMLVDPAGTQAQIEELLSNLPGRLRYIVLTHGHADHVSGLEAAKELTGAEILIHQFDSYRLAETDDQVSRYVGIMRPLPSADRLLSGGEEICLGQLSFQVMHTPGHTEGGICLFGHGSLFSGDTLFAGSIGRYDLPGGDFQVLKSSLAKLKALPNETVVYPGHGPESTIASEKQGNRFFQ